MRLFVERSVRRCVGLAILLFFAVPFGLSVIGCGHHSAPPVYCNGLSSGPVVGQAYAITLAPNLATIGESLNYGQIGQSLSATTADCKGNNVSVSKYTYSSTNLNYADINPSTGAVCGGTWNRQSGSGIPDFTICTPPATLPANGGMAFVTANAEGVTSNAIAVYVHPVVTAVELAAPQSSTPGGCSASDPTSDCCTNVTTTPEPPAPGYDGTSCVSQNNRVQLAGKVFANGSNITCQVGHLTFAAQGSANVVTIDTDGFATANQPGSSTITATISNSSTASNAGFFSTCPPASIKLTAVGQSGNPINVGLNTPQPLQATVLDTNGNQITGISLEFNSTTPQTISASSGTVLPSFPGSATITAVCQPGACNPSPLSQVGYLGNGKPLTSNGITVNTSGNSGEVVYMASTSSQYVVNYDFTQNLQSAPIKLQYVPNSMVMSQDGSTIYFGSPQGIMTLTTSGNAVSAANPGIPGTVLAVSPDGTTVVVTDPTRQTVSLVGTSGAVTTSYGNVVGTSAAWSPDSQTVYITTNNPNILLTHSTFNNWQVTNTTELYTDVTVTVPHIGAYFAGARTDGRSYCPTTTIVTPGSNGNPPTTANEYYPLAGEVAAQTDRVAATTDGNHILGATVAGGTPTLQDISVVLPVQTPCPLPSAPPLTFQNTNNAVALSSITATAIDDVVPATNSALAFVTYTGSSGLLPEYIIPAAGGTGSVTYLQLGNGATSATAPLAGVFSTDNLSFYAGASDGQVHLISIKGTTAAETGVLQPALQPGSNPLIPGSPSCVSSAGTACVNLIAQHPKKLQS